MSRHIPSPSAVRISMDILDSAYAGDISDVDLAHIAAKCMALAGEAAGHPEGPLDPIVMDVGDFCGVNCIGKGGVIAYTSSGGDEAILNALDI